MRDEGVTKYSCIFTETQAPDFPVVDELISHRNKLFALGLIGVYPDGIGYGNLSVRLPGSDRFLITGTQTGHKPRLTPADISLVRSYDILQNRVECEGAVPASSESMTHAAVYELSDEITGVIHVHHKKLWLKGQGLFPTTAMDVGYGTPAMAAEMGRLFRQSALRDIQVLIMAGHDEGVISFGPSLPAAERALRGALAAIAD